MFTHDFELEIISGLQKAMRSPVTDCFFIGWNYVDTFSFLIIVIAVTMFFINRRIGIRLFFLFALSNLVSGGLKELFNFPRPCQIDPLLGLLPFNSTGFPSGAAQTAAIIAGTIFVETKKKSVRLVGLAFAILLCFSRVYLGAHFITDILGGFITGMVLVSLFLFIKNWSEKQQALLFFILFAMLLMIGPFKFAFQGLLGIGGCIGLICLNQNNVENLKGKGAVTAFLMASIGFVVINKLRYQFPVFKYEFMLLGGFWFSYMSVVLTQLIVMVFKYPKYST